MADVGTVEAAACCKRYVVFDWKVDNFAKLSDEIDCEYRSPSFIFWGRRFYMLLFPNGETEEQSEGYMGLYLYTVDSRPPFEARFSLGIRTAKGDTEVWKAATATLGDAKQFWGSETCIKKSKLFMRREELLPLDVLTLTVTLKVGKKEALKKGAKNVSVQTAAEDGDVADAEKAEPAEKTGSEKVLQDLRKLWLGGEHCDVVLKVRDVEFKAHRAILAARTPVLSAMFQHDTAEKASGEVTIDDCDPAVFEQLLHYIYTGAPREVTAENASALYVVADKYLLSEVKKLCVQCMQDTLCLDSFCNTVTFSLMYKENKLLERAINFFARNKLRVLESVEWQVLMRDHLVWANEILIRELKMGTRNGKN